MSDTGDIRLGPAKPEQAEAIADLLTPYVPLGIVLPRSPAEIRAAIGDFIVATDGDCVVGSVSLRDFGNGLQEVRSLVVHVEYGGHGLGSLLVDAAVDLARARGADRVFALTLRPRLFARRHFLQVDMRMFPQKVWSDCVRCPKRERCDEVALLLDLRLPPAVGPGRGETTG